MYSQTYVKEWMETFLERPDGIPSHDTINRVFQMIDPAKFHDAFFQWASTVSGKVKDVVAIDGKTARRSREEAGNIKLIHAVSAWATESSLVPGQLCVDEKTNEIKTIPELLDILCLEGKKDVLEKAECYYKNLCGEHGRIEKKYYVENNIGWLVERHPGWEGLAGIGACISTVTETKKNDDICKLHYIQQARHDSCRIW